MRSARRWVLWAAACAPAVVAASGPAQERLTLDALAKLAQQRYQARAEEQRAAIQPYLSDLELNYADNRSYLDDRFQLMADLGDGIVPLLLARLTPAEEGELLGRTVAENSARVLRLVGTTGYVDALLGLCQGKSYTARLHAIELLGESTSGRAARALAAMLPQLVNETLRTTIDALRKLEFAAAGAEIAKHVDSLRPRLRVAALRYLAALHPPEALAPVLAALAGQPDTRYLDLYLDYVRASARRDAAAADILVALLTNRELDRTQLAGVVAALATVAPEGHGPSLRACREQLRDGEVGRLGLTCALTMRALGDNDGVEMLMAELKTQMNQDRRDAEPYIDRGELFMALGKWTEAARDFRDAIERTRNSSIDSVLQLRIARCEAHRKRYAGVLRALRDSNQTYSAVMRLAARDEVFAQALQQAQIKRFLEQLERGEVRD